jgi:carbamoyl-phosphate synthase large subunit
MINKKNVLLLSAGRRVELLLAIKSEIKERGLNSRVLTTDLNPNISAACHVADQAFAISRVTEEGYMDQLLELCEEQEVGLVIPTIDTELLGLSQARSRFAEKGIQLVVSDEELITKCRDKRRTAQFFASLGIDTPKLLDRSHLTFPCFAKPYDGSRSIGAAKLSQPTDLTETMRNDSKLMFMEYIDRSFDEYTVDVYFDRQGHLKCLVPRHRLEVRDGEISKGVTRKNHVYQYLQERLKKIQGARGCLTVQLFVKPDGQRYAALEINPRFGGGYPLSYAAGAKYPGWLIDEYLLSKEIPFFDGWETDLLMLRYDAQVLAHHVM